MAKLDHPVSTTSHCPIAIPALGETTQAIDRVYGAYCDRFLIDAPEEQFELDVMALSHIDLRRLAIIGSGVAESMALQVRDEPPSPAFPHLRSFNYAPDNPMANHLVAGNAAMALIDHNDPMEKLSKIQARVVNNFHKANRMLKEMRHSPIDGLNRHLDPNLSIECWANPAPERS